MKNKGFTLIELLAVIVILAIIALIATPIILGIINDARKESNERSVELYAAAVKNGIAAHQLTEGKEVKAGTYTKDTLPFDVDVDGKVECNTIDIYKDGSIYVADCSVNDKQIDYTYGTKKYEPQYYYFGFDWSGIVGSADAPAESERLTVAPTGKNIYLGYDVTNGVVTSGYVCFKREENGTEYCLKGGDEGAAYDTNKTVLEEAFGASACSFDGDDSSCSAGGLNVSAWSYGDVYAYAASTSCNVLEGGDFGCYN